MGLQVNYLCLTYSELQDRSLGTIQNEKENKKNMENSENTKRPRGSNRLACSNWVPEKEKKENCAETIWSNDGWKFQRTTETHWSTDLRTSQSQQQDGVLKIYT